MKKFLFSILFFFCISTSFCQQQTSLTQEAYLQKSSRQKTGAWVLAASSVGLITTAIVTFKPNYIFWEDTHIDNTVPAVASVLGTGALVGSILLFDKAGKSKRKAMAIRFGNQPVPGLHSNSIVFKRQTVLHIHLSL